MTVPAPYDLLLDERGSLCPMPIIALARASKQFPEATILLLADDPAAVSDVPAWCTMRSRVLVWAGMANDVQGQAFLVAPAPDNEP